MLVRISKSLLLVSGSVIVSIVLFELSGLIRVPLPEATTFGFPPEPARSGTASKAPPLRDNLIAHRRYELLLHGKRAASLDIVWTRETFEGREVVKDVTRTHRRTARMMGPVKDIFEAHEVAVIYRTEDGDLIQSEITVNLPGRRNRSTVRRVPEGYRVTSTVGSNTEDYFIPTDEPAKLDAEAFLGVTIRAGEAVPGAKFKCRMLNHRTRSLTDAHFLVVGPDDEGPGLKVIQTIEGFTVLWWFADDGSVVRQRAGDSVIRRNDSIGLDDLPRAPPSFRVTLRSDRELPRLFTADELIVELTVRTDETTESPRIAPNPFTEVLERTRDRVRLKLKSYDNAESSATRPVSDEKFAEFLKATPLMEVDDPVVREAALTAVGEETDARKAATRIADYVFRALRKQSPEIGELTAREILEQRIGDCSEHARLFVALCRSAGIPARRCSGYVCIGSHWGGHAWSEIWIGAWIGADPTTNEIGTRARYIFTSREDDPDTRPAYISAERSRISIRRATFSDGVIDFEQVGEPNPVVFSGIRLAELPKGWTVRHTMTYAKVQGPDVTATFYIRPDQGYRSLPLLRRRRGRSVITALGSRSALRTDYGGNRTAWVVPLGRQNLLIDVRGKDLPNETLAAILKPTLERDDG